MTEFYKPEGGDLEMTGGEAIVRGSGTPTQVQHPWRATLRTIFAAVLAATVLLPTILPIVTDWAAEQAWLPEGVGAAVAAVTAVVVAVAGLITRLLAVPGVNAWLSRFLPFLAAD